MNEEQENSGVSQEAAAPPATESLEAHSGQGNGEQLVPLSALQSERAQRQEKEREAQRKDDEARMLREHIALLQANMGQPQQKQDDFGGLSETDVLTVGEARRAMNEVNRQFQLSIEELRMTQKYPDYQEVVVKHLPEVLKGNPRLEGTLKQTQDYELAYYLAKNSESYKNENKKKKINADAERIVQNSQMPGSLASVGSVSPISNAKRYKEMSDEEFAKEVMKNSGYL